MKQSSWIKLSAMLLVLLVFVSPSITLTAAASPLSDEKNVSVTNEQIMLTGTIDGKSVELAVMVYRPAGVATPRPTIILTHGRRGHSPSRYAKEVESSPEACNAIEAAVNSIR